ncbi:Thiaminase-2/PQQC, partial [Dillenia turbinata]
SEHFAEMKDEEGLAKKFWIKFKSEPLFVIYSPFVISLAADTLHSDCFLHFLSQDVRFYTAFAHAYELAEECADDDDDKSAIRKLRKRVLEKLKVHDNDVREWGFELPKESSLDNATVKYTNFLLATASGKVEGEKGKIATPFEKTKIAAYTVGAVAPFMRLYTFISKEILGILNHNEQSHAYKKWMDSYSSQEFEESAIQTELALDKLSISLTGEELDIIEKLYHQALKLEADFFTSQSINQQIVVPLSRAHPACCQLSMFCDFDLTCTAYDSAAILAEIAIVTAQKAGPQSSESQITRMSSADLRNTWGVLSNQYTEEYEQTIESIMPTKRVAKFDHEALRKALEQLLDFEKTANSRVINSGVLKGINMEEIKRAGQQLIFQDGCKEFFKKIVNDEKLKTDVHILSYCWCGDLIKSALSSGGLDALQVHSNELAYIESITTGEIIEKMGSPMEKLQTFSEILNRQSRPENHLTVYIGGTVGDLLCLLEADIGIVMGSSASLRALGYQFGVSFVPLFSGVVKKQIELNGNGSCPWKKLSGSLYTVSSWAEIHAFILGL